MINIAVSTIVVELKHATCQSWKLVVINKLSVKVQIVDQWHLVQKTVKRLHCTILFHWDPNL